jgi:hypothetical protein
MGSTSNLFQKKKPTLTVWDMLALHDVQKYNLEEHIKSDSIKEDKTKMKRFLETQVNHVSGSKNYHKESELIQHDVSD